MGKRKFDLKGFRENSLKMTQAKFAELIDVSQETVSRMEKNPDSITMEILDRIVENTGVDYNELRSYKRELPEPLRMTDTWAGVSDLKNQMLKKIAEIRNTYENADVNNIENVIFKSFKKPKVVFLGRSDSGKSTMINALIGSNVMPTKWTPSTSIIVYVKHIDDKPAFIEEDLWLFRRGENEEWDDSRLNDEQYCREWKIAGGNVEMLSTYGIHDGERFSDNVGSAVYFTESDILKNCDLLDVPGLTEGEETDNKMAEDARLRADVVIYLSSANGFLSSGSDMLFIRNAINSMTRLGRKKTDVEMNPLANLFIVATQAHITDHGSKETLNAILESGTKRLLKNLSNNEKRRLAKLTGKEVDEELLRGRFFTYTTDIESARVDFEKQLADTIVKLPFLIREDGIKMVKLACEDLVTEIVNELKIKRGISEEKEKYARFLEEIRASDVKRAIKNDEAKRELLDVIREHKLDSETELDEEYSIIVSEKNVRDIIEKHELSSKAKDMEQLGTFVNSELKDSLENILDKHSKEFSKKVNDYISSFDENCKVISGDIKGGPLNGINLDGFNAGRAFASGLAGIATYGGLAAWAATLGNLGGYILISKGVSLLAAMGIHIAGGTAAVVSAVSAIGGPIVLAIGLALLATLGIFGIFSGGWQKKAAKKVCEAFKKQGVLAQYKDIITKYWDDTRSAFLTASKSMEDEWICYIKDVESQVNNGIDKETLDNEIAAGEALCNSIKNIVAQS